MKADFSELLRINPDTIGWLSIPNTPINYPVVQGTDNVLTLSTCDRSKYGADGRLVIMAIQI